MIQARPSTAKITKTVFTTGYNGFIAYKPSQLCLLGKYIIKGYSFGKFK